MAASRPQNNLRPKFTLGNDALTPWSWAGAKHQIGRQKVFDGLLERLNQDAS